MNNQQTCANCRFFNSRSNGIKECRRRAPTKNNRAIDCNAIYVDSDGWCGEFEPEPIDMNYSILFSKDEMRNES